MSIDKQALREKFEAWAEEAGALPWGHLKKQRTASGNYSVQIYTYMWKAWSACNEALLDELDKYQQESSTWQSVAEKQLAIATEMEAKLQAAEKTSEARREAIDRTHKMYQREVERAESAESRIAELGCIQQAEAGASA